MVANSSTGKEDSTPYSTHNIFINQQNNRTKQYQRSAGLTELDKPRSGSSTAPVSHHDVERQMRMLLTHSGGAGASVARFAPFGQ